MNFTSYEFLLFFLIIFAAYWLVRKQMPQNLLLLAAPPWYLADHGMLDGPDGRPVITYLKPDTFVALAELVGQRPGADQSIYLQVTRGAAPKRDHAIPEGVTPNVFAMTTPLAPIDPSVAADGIAAITLDDLRWQRCDIKATTLLANVLARQIAKERGALEAILIRDGLALEGAASNLFVFAAGRLVTPPKSPLLLPGITRDLVIELAQANHVPLSEADVPLAALATADEIWLTSSTREVMPVTRLDGKPVGTGRPGPVWRRMNDLYQSYKAYLRQHPDA